MRVLILSMTCGQGHNAIAKSLRENFSDQDTVEVFDIFGLTTKLSKKENDAYIWAITNVPHIYDFVWNEIRKKDPTERYTSMNIGFIKPIKQYNIDKINSFAPDAIICTHNYASNMVSVFKKEKLISENIKLFAILTDYCTCPFWETSILCDKVFTPHEITHTELLDRGFKKEQLLPLGFPVAKKFEETLNKPLLRQKFGFEENDFVIMSMIGGLGQGKSLPIVKIFVKHQKIINKNIRLILFCGKNEKQRKKLQTYITKNNLEFVKVLGFVDNVEEYMCACDANITRAGANSITECLYAKIVPIIREDMIANEQINKEIFIDNNLCYGIEKVKELPKLIKYIISNPTDVAIKKSNMSKFIKPSPVSSITDYVKNFAK